MSKPTSAIIQKSNEEKFINHLMKNGKKSVAKKIYENTLYLIVNGFTYVETEFDPYTETVKEVRQSEFQR